MALCESTIDNALTIFEEYISKQERTILLTTDRFVAGLLRGDSDEVKKVKKEVELQKISSPAKPAKWCQYLIKEKIKKEKR